MSEIKVTGQKRLVLVSGRAHPQLAIDIAEELGSELVHTGSHCRKLQPVLCPKKKRRPLNPRFYVPCYSGASEHLSNILHGTRFH